MFDQFSRFPGSLLADLRRAQQEMEGMIGPWPGRSAIRSVARSAYPAINVGSTPDHVDVFVFAAGLDAEAIELSLHHNLLTISGERKAANDANVDYYRKERFDGAFRRTVTLPDDIEPDDVDARYRHGILHVRVQRRQAARPRRISVSQA